MGHEVVETTSNFTTNLAQKLLMNIQCSVGSRSFAKEARALKKRIIVVGHQKWQQRIESHHRS